MYLKLPEYQSKSIVFILHASHNQSGRNKLGNRSGSGHTGHIHVKVYDKKHVETHIDYSCCSQVVKWSLGIALCSEHCTAKVVDHHCGHPKKIYS